MILVLARNWWSLLIRGIAAIVFGLLAFAWPGITFTALVLLFGAYALVDGVVSIAGAVRASREHERWGALVLEGVTGILAAVFTIAWPAITALALVYVIAAWAALTGIFEIAAAVRLRRHIQGELLLALSGVLSLILAFLLIVAPAAGALAIALWVGAYAVVFGAVEVALALRLRAWAKRPVSQISGEWRSAA